jgi:nitrogenase molybdenum-iron cofactor biosynthesis protein NifN
MNSILTPVKAVSTNPLKVSPALGAALAFLGIDRCIPLFHGSQGCTAFALVLMVRHFREAIPLQTTAMNELSTILGGADHVEEAIINLRTRAQPRLIGLCSTALTETRGEDMAGDLKTIRGRHPEWTDLDVVYASTPDYMGGLQEGWGAAVKATIEALVPEVSGQRTVRQVNLLPGSHLTPGDVEELRDLIESFGLQAVVLPDLSRSLDGWVPDSHVPTSLGGTSMAEIRSLGQAVLTFAVGEQMRPAAEALTNRTGVPHRVLATATGLDAVDAMVETLIELSGSGPTDRVKRERSRLVDAMLDAHFPFGEARVAIAAEPDLLLALARLATSLGAKVSAAVTSVSADSLSDVPADNIHIGDLGDLEDAASGADVILTNAHGAGVAQRLHRPLYRVGFPIFDRLGAAHAVSVGYRGTRRLIFDLANLLLDHGAGDAETHAEHRDNECLDSRERRVSHA